MPQSQVALDLLEIIRNKLNHRFSPLSLELIDESSLHMGHLDAPQTPLTHLRIRIVSEIFQGQTRLFCHRMIYEQLTAECRSGLHAIAIEASAPRS